MTEQETTLATVNPGETTALTAPTPAHIIEFYTDVANRLSDIVETQNLYSTISGKKHLDAEAWETIITLDGAHSDIEWVRDIVENGELTGFKARALIVKNGETLASGEMSCGLDDFPCRGKSGTAARRSGESTAQTWAIAKAARLKYAWVVTLAGYSPLPSNEAMDIVQQPRERSQRPAQARRQAPKPSNGPAQAMEPDDARAPSPVQDWGVVYAKLRSTMPEMLNQTQFGKAMQMLELPEGALTEILGQPLADYMELNDGTSYVEVLETVLTALEIKLQEKQGTEKEEQPW